VFGLFTPGGRWGKFGKVLAKADDIGGGGRAAAGALRGTRNPVVAKAARRGQAAHKAYDPGPTYIKEFVLPSGRRIDAVDLNRRVIRELKPNNPRAIAKGWKKLDIYTAELKKIYGGSWIQILDTY
jgi:hypothetical protein